jgi:signal transduction histidine kinase
VLLFVSGEIVRAGFSFNSIRTRLTFWLLVMTMIPLFMVNVAIYIYMVNSMKVSLNSRLEAVRDIKVSELNHWLKERISDIHTIADDNEIRTLEKIGEGKAAYDQRDAAIISEGRDFLRRYLLDSNDYYEIFVVSPQTHKIIVSTDKKNEGRKPLSSSHYEGALRSSKLFIEDIHYSKTLNKPCFALSMPIYSLMGRNLVIGILVARINLETSLYNLLSNSTGMGETGEVLIVNKDAIALNELRWHKGSALKMKLTSRPAVEASLGNTGVIEAYDYRGEMVLAAYTYIPQTGWGFVAKQELKEVYAPIYQLRNWMLAIGVITFFGVIIVAFCVSRSISNPINALHKGSEIIGRGNLDYKVGTAAKDEIGELSRTFDLMIENLKAITASKDELNKEIAERKHLEKMLLEIREHERRRIGHDLHDNLGQQLTAISFMAHALENMLRKKTIPEAEDMARITHLIEMAKAQVKSLSIGLSPILGSDEYSLVTAIVDLASNSEKLFGIPCIIKCSNNIVSLHNNAALIHLYRIAQEAITNSARHSRTGQIELSFMKENNVITMTIKDDGKGFALPDQGNGMGLEIMRYRAGMINASLNVRSELDKGTIVTCVFLDIMEG